MARRISRRLLLAGLTGLVLASAPTLALDPGELLIETPAGQHRFTIELAATPSERSRGLMFRRAMQPDHGMLFDFQTPQQVAFWMKNTPLPLDMLFIDGAGLVVQIAADTVPYSETPIPSEQPIRAVLELNAGTAKRLGITAGAKVKHAIFAGPS
ncbi:MAG: DUF192 domain-containing protein [Geminicoccaceae bacterium]